MKNYLITGGCGFIGQHLAERLLLKKKCHIDLIDLPGKKNFVDSKNINLIKADISKENVFKKLKKNMILLSILRLKHLAT